MVAERGLFVRALGRQQPPDPVDGPSPQEVRVTTRRLHPNDALPALLKRALTARADGRIADAVRLIDRAYRLHQDAHAQLYRPYAELLTLDGHDDQAAIAMWLRASSVATDEALEASLIEVLLRTGDVTRARARLGTALARLAVTPFGPLYTAAVTCLQQDATDTAGFIALGPDWVLRGWGPPAGQWWVRVDGVRITGLRPDAAGHWHVPLTAAAYSAVIDATYQERVVIGSGVSRAPDGGLTASLMIQDHSATLVVRSEWDPTFIPVLRIQSGHLRARRSLTLRPEQTTLDTQRGRLQYRWSRRALADEHPWALSLTTPCGAEWTPPESPLLWPRAARLLTPRARSQVPRQIPVRAPTVIVVPVYAGRSETLACLQSLRLTRPPKTRVLVVDDATPEPELARDLDALAGDGVIELLRHPVNRGFAAAVNTALKACRGHDVVLVNADTVLRGDWLERMTHAAYAKAAHGTVTPWSADGSIVSYPLLAPDAAPLPAAELTALVADVCDRQTVELPVGVGFCLYLRHDCWAAVGEFAADVFGRGYGEETDYCLRARALGYRSVLAADVYVEHIGGRSFGTRRDALWRRAQRLIELRHPGYARAVGRYLARDPLASLRRRLDETRLRRVAKPTVLLVSLALGGGVGAYVAARQRALQSAGYRVVLLTPDGIDARERVRIRAPLLALEDLAYDMPQDMDALVTLLSHTALTHIELNHVLNLPFDLIDALYTLGVPVDVQLHDYVYLCPQVTMMGRHGRYCEEAPLSECVRCVRAQGSSFGAGLGAAALRQRATPWLRRARRVQAPSADTAERYQRYFPGLAVTVLEHAPVLERAPTVYRASDRVRTRVALLGAIGDHKGYRVLLACARYAVAHDLPLEFVVIGYTHDDAPLAATGRVFITGPYADEELLPLLQRESPDVLFLASVWPETWSYTLDAALKTDLPIVAFDLGAIAHRLSPMARGNLLPLNTRTDALCAALQAARTRGASLDTARLPQGVIMAELDPNALTATVQVLPLPAGVYLFSVQAGATTDPRPDAGLPLPALHVGIGPGVSAGDIDIMGRAGETAGWLVRGGDFLVLRLRAERTQVLVTSLQDGLGNALTVRAERLDSRFSVDAPGETMPSGEPVVGLPLHIAAHVRNRGDMTFVRSAWAGRVEKGLWIESFSIRPLEGLSAADVEYKSLTSSGFETPWISNEKLCGTQGMGVPLIGFAVRLKPGPRVSAYDIEYTGAFASGALVGPLKNGVPCRSTVGNDALEGLQVRIVPRNAAHAARPTSAKTPAKRSTPTKTHTAGKRAPAPAVIPKGKAKSSLKTKPAAARLALAKTNALSSGLTVSATIARQATAKAPTQRRKGAP